MVATPTTFERKWPTVIITGIGVVNSLIVVPSILGLHVKMLASLIAPGQPVLDVEIKRIISDTQFYVGEPKAGIADYYKQADLAYYIGGTISAQEQNRNPLGSDPVLRAVYDEEPAVALRTILVDEFGQHHSAVNPVPVSITEAITVDVDLDAFNSTPDNVMIVGTQDGTKTGAKFGYVNNIRGQILASHDRVQAVSYADFGTKNERITQIDYTSATFPGVTARKVIS